MDDESAGGCWFGCVQEEKHDQHKELKNLRLMRRRWRRSGWEEGSWSSGTSGPTSNESYSSSSVLNLSFRVQ